MDQWETIRLRCVRDGEPIKVVARDLGLSKNTVRKYVRSLQAPQHQGIERESKLSIYRYHIDDLIRRSPRITAVRIGAVLRAYVDPDLEVNERTLRLYVASRRREIVAKKAFVRALYAPGDQMQFVRRSSSQAQKYRRADAKEDLVPVAAHAARTAHD